MSPELIEVRDRITDLAEFDAADDVRESAELITGVVADAVAGREGLPFITDQGTNAASGASASRDPETVAPMRRPTK